MYTPFAKKSPKLFCPFQLIILNPLGALGFSTENIFFPPKEYISISISEVFDNSKVNWVKSEKGLGKLYML